MPNNRTGTYLKCLNCPKEIYVTRSKLRANIRRFCSLKCVSQFTAPERAKKLTKKVYPFTLENKCPCCGGDIIIKSSSFDKGYRKYCSMSCVTRHRNLTDNPLNNPVHRMTLSKSLTVHGHSKKPLFKVWLEIKRRCESEKSEQYKNYGGRGINLSDEWHDFNIFEEWANKTGYKKGLTIERVDVNGNYEKENCTWVLQSEQSKNRRPSSEWHFKKRI